jgi:hypothetical protein
LENEILRFELKLCNFEELQENVEKTLENVKQEIQGKCTDFKKNQLHFNSIST